MSRIDPEVLAELREGRGMTIGQIALRLGATHQTIAWQCLTLGLERGGVSPPPTPIADAGAVYARDDGIVVRRFTPEEDVRLRALAVAGVPRKAIARTLGRAGSSIIGRLATLARHDARREAHGG